MAGLPPSEEQITQEIEDLKARTGVTDEQLDSEVKETDCHHVAGCFVSADDQYLIELGLKRIDQTTVKDIRSHRGHQAAMTMALTMWQDHNSATFKRIIRILIKLKEVNSARKVCEYLNNKIFPDPERGGEGGSQRELDSLPRNEPQPFLDGGNGCTDLTLTDSEPHPPSTAESAGRPGSNSNGQNDNGQPPSTPNVYETVTHENTQSYRELCAGTIVILDFICRALVTLAFVGIAIGFGVYGHLYTLPSKSVYATNGQTVIITEFSNPLSGLIWNTISECPDPNDDFPHSNHLYLVEKDQLARKKRSVRFNFTDVINQTGPDCSTNLLSDGLYMTLYLLVGSTIEFEICITASEELHTSGTLLIFDNNEAYEQYITDNDCESVRGAHVHNLNIGSFGAFECTSIYISTYVSSVNGYHYIIANTPGKVQFRYRYSYEQYYLDPNDFVAPAVCSFSSEGDNLCTFNDVTSETVYAIVSVDPSEVDNSISTHICVSSQWTHGLTALVICFGVLSFIICFVVCLWYIFV